MDVEATTGFYYTKYNCVYLGNTMSCVYRDYLTQKAYLAYITVGIPGIPGMPDVLLL